MIVNFIPEVIAAILAIYTVTLNSARKLAIADIVKLVETSKTLDEGQTETIKNINKAIEKYRYSSLIISLNITFLIIFSFALYKYGSLGAIDYVVFIFLLVIPYLAMYCINNISNRYNKNKTVFPSLCEVYFNKNNYISSALVTIKVLLFLLLVLVTFTDHLNEEVIAIKYYISTIKQLFY